MRQQVITAYRKAVDPGKSRATFVVSDGSLDRHNTTVNPHGWSLDAYRRNPVVLFAHNYDAPPVGKCLSIGVVDEKLLAEIQFHDLTPLAAQVKAYVMGGFLNACSVGFAPLESEGARSGDPDKYTEHILRQELLEISMVPVPANGGALIVPGSQKSILSKEKGPMRNFQKGVSDDFAFKTSQWHTYCGRAFPDHYQVYKGWINLQGTSLPDLSESAVKRMLADTGNLDPYKDIDAVMGGQTSFKIVFSERKFKAMVENEFARQDERCLSWSERVLGMASFLCGTAGLTKPSDSLWAQIRRDAADCVRRSYNAHLRVCARCTDNETRSDEDFIGALQDFMQGK